jgi:hypothetical protein
MTAEGTVGAPTCFVLMYFAQFFPKKFTFFFFYAIRLKVLAKSEKFAVISFFAEIWFRQCTKISAFG